MKVKPNSFNNMKNLQNIFDLSGKRALISGDGTGIGKLGAEILAAHGAKVVLAARRIDKLEATVEELQRNGGKASAITMDVTNSESIAEGLEQASADGPITILINSAGVGSEPLLLNLTEEEWDRVQATNLKGAWMLSKAVVQQMIDAEQSGNIINIASMLGIAAQKGTGPYMASKAALIHLTRSMAVEWARYGIRANAIAPGYFMTDIAEGFLESEPGQAMTKRIPARRFGNLPDLAGPILLLASDAGAYMTGSTTVVDGGHSIPVV